MTIRTKILTLLAGLTVMAVSEAGLVLYFQRLTLQHREAVDRRAEVRDLQAQLELALLEMKSGARDTIRMGRDNPGAAAAADTYHRLLAGLRGATHDAQQRERLDDLAGQVQQWHSGWPRPRPTAGTAEIRDAITELEAGFAPIRTGLTVFRQRQDALYEEAQSRSRRTFRRYTALMLVIPGVAVFVMAIAITAVRRVLLDPLQALADDSRRIAGGEYPDLQKPERRDEIGDLVNAFVAMITTLRKRETELSGALDVSRAMTTRARESEETAQRARAELETVVETVPAALLLVDRSGGVRFQNRAATRLIGAPPTEDTLTVYRSEFSLVARDGTEMPHERWPLVRALSGETIPGEEATVRGRDGREVPMLISAAPMPDGTGDAGGAIVVFQDVSALKAIDRLKDDFVSIVSHELRTPLTSIRGSLQLVLDDPANVPDDDHRQLVQIALNNCERLIRIINDILDIAKIEAGKTALSTRPCAVRDLVRTAIENVEAIARNSSVAFALQIPDDLPPVVADPDRIVQVLVNLLSNALKFAPPRSRVLVEAAERGGLVEVSVADRGQGIAPDQLPQLFQKFQQLDSSATRAKGGTGLGLAIVRGLVEQHGGTVSVESTPGEGTRFSFTLPVAATAAAPRDVPAPRAIPTAARVLLVDDDDDFRAVVRRQLERAGFQVTEARDGEEALARGRAERPDVIALDLMMPGMNGWTLLRTLNDDPSLCDIPTVVISAVADRAGNLARDVAVVSKAAGVEALVSEIAALLPSVSGQVLIAEDDDDLRSLIARTLRKRGLSTLEARNGAEALAMVNERVSLLVLDLNMPDVDGLAVLRELRERSGTRQLPVLVITGTEGYRDTAIELGAAGYLTKPLEVSEVARIVQGLIAHQDG